LCFDKISVTQNVHRLFSFHFQNLLHKILATTTFGEPQQRRPVRCWWEVSLHIRKIGSGYNTNNSVWRSEKCVYNCDIIISFIW